MRRSLNAGLIDRAVSQLHRAFDSTYGGFGSAPKFPHPMDLQLLVRVAQRTGQQGPLDMVRLTLDRMAAGGIYDHLGGGFARYSVDARWLVPHFEKMLYDNALLAEAYLDAYLVTGDANYARVLRETLNYVIRDMTDPAGGFYSTEDADSEGHEGLFYTWTPDEIEAVLGDERGATFGRVYDVSDVGNFEGRNILNLPKTLEQCGSHPAARAGGAGRRAGREPRETVRRPREARAARPRRQGDRRLEWPHDRRHGPSRRGAQRAGVRHHGRRSRQLHPQHACGATMAACFTPVATARPSSMRISTTTPRSPIRS